MSPKRQRPVPELDLGIAERDAYGLIATWVEVETGETRVLVRLGVTAMEGLCEMIEEVEAGGGQWRLRTISTPRTIFRDLQGTRRPFGMSREHGIAMPESRYLGKIDRLDLLESPALNPMPVDAESR